MGFLQIFAGVFDAAGGAIGGTLADQFTEFLTVPEGISPTAALFPAELRTRNAGRGANRPSEHVITNGSRVIVPEGYGLLTFQDGAISGCITQAGGYVWDAANPQAKSVFTGGGSFGDLIQQSWERFKAGGMPNTQQLAYFVSLKELPNNRFGTQSEIYWDDAFLGTQVGAIARGTYSMQIVDPILFVKSCVPATYISGGDAVFDFNDMDNPVGEQLFTEVVGSLAPAFARYTNDPTHGHRMAGIQSDSVGFGQALSEAVEANYNWRQGRGLIITRCVVAAIEYDEDTRELLKDAKRADALRGDRGNSFMQQSVARGIQAAGENGGSGGMMGMGVVVPQMGGVMGGLQQPPAQGQTYPGYQQPQGYPQMPGQPQQAQPQGQQASQPQGEAEDPVAKLKQMKELVDSGVISQEEFEAAKKKFLGL